MDAFRRLLRTRLQSWQDLDVRVRRMDLRLRLAEARRRHESAAERLRSSMEELLRKRTDALAAAKSHVKAGDLQRRVEGARARLDSLTAQLTHLSPLHVLQRGYAIVQDSSGHVIKDSAETAVGADLRVRLAKGTLNVEVR